MKSVSQSLLVSNSGVRTNGVFSPSLSNSFPLYLVGSDGQGERLEAIIPAKSLDFSKATTSDGTLPQGNLKLMLSQLYGHSSNATTTLGTFQLQIIDGRGQTLQGIHLHAPITFIYHYQAQELSTLSLDPGKVFLIWPDQLASDAAMHKPLINDVISMHNTVATHTLTVQSTLLSSTPFDLGTGTSAIQNPPRANFASVQGNGGQLSYAYPLVVAPGPKGTDPTLVVSYSSEATNERHTPTSPANNIGDGWSLSMGSISAEKYPDGTIWYSISGVDNVSDRLIPDSSGTNYATEHLSYLKVKKNTSLNCFQVWDTEGNYYEFGCTTDSLQYYVDSSGNRTNYSYDLNKVIPANDGAGTNSRIMNLSYVEDQETSGGHTWIREAALKQISYGSGTTLAGVIDFFYNGPSNYTDPNNHVQYVSQYSSIYETNCHLPTPSPQPQRCDDPIDRSGGLPDPDVMSTLSLQSVKTYVGDDSSTSHLDYSYNFTYQESAFGNCPSADTTLSSAYCAGSHLLTSITPTAYQNGTGHQLPGVTFGYSGGRPNKYDDNSHSYHMENNWSYLTSYHDHSNGVGASNIVYHTAYNNSHGTPYIAGDNRYDALFCINNSGSCNSGSSFYPMDDKMWTLQVVTQITSVGKDSTATGLAPSTTTYDYWLTKTQGSCPADTASPPNSDCVGFGWIPNSSNNWQSFYNGEFRGFGQVLETSPAGNLSVQNYASTWGWDSPMSDSRNYLAGHLLEEDIYQGNTINTNNLLSKTTYTYAGQNGTHNSCAQGSTYPTTTYGPCEVILLSTRTTTYEKTGGNNANAPWVQNDSTYDDYTPTGGLGDYHQAPATGSYHNLQQEVITSSNAPTSTQHWTYYTTNTTSGSQIYYNVHTVAHKDLVDSNNHMWHCEDINYDEGTSGVPTPDAGWPTTTTAYSNCSNQNAPIKTYTGYDAAGNVVASVDAVGVANSSLYSSAGCSLNPAPAIFTASSNWNIGHYTDCASFNSTSAMPTDVWNVFGHHTHLGYDATHGLVPTSTIDINGQTTTTSYSYDSNGNSTAQINQPGEVGTYTAQSTAKSICTDSSALPCFEMDSNDAQYASAMTRTFYDTMGREVETLTPGPDASHTTVSFTVYNDQTNSNFESLPFVVNSRTTWLDPNGAMDYSGNTPAGVGTVLDAVDSTSSIIDPLSHQSSVLYTLGSVPGDNNIYEKSTSSDANNHVQEKYTDAQGRLRYEIEDSGTSGRTLSANTQTAYQYNVLGEQTSIVVTDLAPQSGQNVTSVTTTDQYDDLGRLVSRSDPDRGSHTFSYDGDGHVISDVSGSRTLGYNYDLLGRVGCIQDAVPTPDVYGACGNGNNPFVQNTYDTDPNGVSWGSTNYAIGELTQSIATNYYPGPDNARGKVTENTQYDQRGRVVTQRMQITTTGGTLAFPTFPAYQETRNYNDGNQLTMTQTTTGGQPGYTFTQSYDNTTGNLNGLSNTAIGTPTLAALNYNNPQGEPSDIIFKDSLGANLANENLQYDGYHRLTQAATTWLSGSNTGNTIYSDSVNYDAVGNVISKATTQAAVPGVSGSGGSVTENFCYDEQNQMVWASNAANATVSGGQTCGTAALQGTLGSSYTNAYVYTHLGQIWQGPLNGNGTQEQYLYCNTEHAHQVTALASIGNNPTCTSTGTTDYRTTYDNWGNVTGRTYPSTTGAMLSYDGLDQLVRWNSTTTTNNQEEWYMYDASGHRVMRRSASTTATGDPASSSATITVYAFNLEEHTYQYAGSGNSMINSSNTYYYLLGNQLIGMLSGTGTLFTSFALTDTLGSVVATISNTAGSAAVLGNQAYGPYGNQLYSAGSLGTTKGFTGQYNDGLTGLDYYNARYYDPVIGRFLSADTVEGNQQGSDPYAYVSDNPETKNDPTGLCGFGSWGDFGDCFTKAAQTVKSVVRHVTNVVHRVVTTVQNFVHRVSVVVHQVQVQVARPLIHKIIVWAVRVAAVVVGGAILHYIARHLISSKGMTNGQIVKRIRSTAQSRWTNMKNISQRNNTNYGGGHIQLFGPNTTSGRGKSLNGQGDFSPGFLSPDPKAKGHTEEQTIAWAKDQIKAHSKSQIGFVKLIIYTMNVPCGPSQQNCAGKLGGWAKDISNRAGGADVEIDVWTSNGSNGAVGKYWNTFKYP